MLLLWQPSTSGDTLLHMPPCLPIKFPQLNPEQGPSTSSSNMLSPIRFLSNLNFVLPVQLAHSGKLSSFSVLIDSCEAGNFISGTLATKLQLPLQPLQHPLKVQELDGVRIRGWSVTNCTESITLHVSALHQEQISLLLSLPSFRWCWDSYGCSLIHRNEISLDLLEGMWNHTWVGTLPCQLFP